VNSSSSNGGQQDGSSILKAKEEKLKELNSLLTKSLAHPDTIVYPPSIAPPPPSSFTADLPTPASLCLILQKFAEDGGYLDGQGD